MDIRQITPDYSVAGQISPDDIEAIKAAGYKSIISNRPDGEQPGQPTAAEIGQLALAAGLEFRHVPVISGQMTPENVMDHAKALEDMPKPVFAFCRSGARSTNIFEYARQMGSHQG